MDEEKITLDRDSFRALASDTRVAILKSLGRRRKMLTELSKQLGMSPSTVKEHMDSLSKAGLVVMIDDGHKWKYYELTRKGESVLHPVGTRIWILLSVSIVGMIAAAWDMLRSGMQTYALAGGRSFDALNAPAAAPVLESAQKAAEVAAETATPAVPYLHMAALVLFGAVAALCAFHIMRKRA
jgi:DNA-binding transcriptional ArsR family regulator